MKEEKWGFHLVVAWPSETSMPLSSVANQSTKVAQLGLVGPVRTLGRVVVAAAVVVGMYSLTNRKNSQSVVANKIEVLVNRIDMPPQRLTTPTNPAIHLVPYILYPPRMTCIRITESCTPLTSTTAERCCIIS